jgi:hypothetical protein
VRYRPSRKFRKTALGATAFVALAGLNAPAAVGFAERQYHGYVVNQPRYKAEYGHWQLVSVPKRFRINSIHAALLHTGKVLLIAGSGNNVRDFKAGTFKSVLWDPADNSFKEIPTPKDMFCSGHAQLPDGNLLVAGGTARYEVLKGDVHRAGGAMVVKNENPDRPRFLPKGTVFVGAGTGKRFRSQFPVLVPRAVKRTARTRAGFEKTTVTASEAQVYVESVRDGEQGIANTADQYEIAGLHGRDRANDYGLATKLGLDKKDFQGLRLAYEFDPVAERYVQVESMSVARWYPTLVSLKDGRVMAVSGLDDMGQIIPGKNEIFDPRTRRWSKGPTHYFPTYPALFLTKGGNLFYSGSNAGYGPADQGRTPGIWNPYTNTFRTVPGLADPNETETSASVLLPPAQRQKVAIFGGGGVGESHASTARTAVVDLGSAHPRFRTGPSLPQGTRYLNAVITPDDTVFTSGGSRDYRGKRASDILGAQIYHPDSNTFTRAAAPSVGRDYHSEALLLPDGRIAVFGSNPLFADKADTQPGVFEQRIEVYTPPYLYGKHAAGRPELGGDAGNGQDTTVEVSRGGTATVPAADPAGIRTVRLMRPSAVTHVTDVEQRSIAIDRVRRGKGSISFTVPEDPSLVPSGWYMLFVTDRRGTPSKAVWLHVR